MKKLGKLLLFGTAALAACAGVYYFLNKKDSENVQEDFDAFDDLEDDDDDADRTYVSLNLSPTESADEESAKEADTKPSTKVPDELTDLDDIEDEASGDTTEAEEE